MNGCRECGAGTRGSPTFCSDPCRKAFNNRRLVRGAELYDLLMCWRYERALAARLHVWRAVCRLLAKYRGEDRAAREGRQSWKRPTEILGRHVYLSSTTISNNAGGARRAA